MFRAVFFFSLLGSMLLGNLAWWRASHVAAGRLKHSRVARILIGLWAGTMFATLMLLILARRTAPEVMDAVPIWVLAIAYLWHLLFVLSWLAWRAVRNAGLLTRWASKKLRAKPQAEMPSENAPLLTSRRQFLTAAAIATPP